MRGEMVTYSVPEVFRYTQGLVVDKDGQMFFDRSPCASDGLVWAINYATGRAWIVPVPASAIGVGVAIDEDAS